MKVSEWLQRNTGVFLLFFLFSFTMSMVVHIIHHNAQDSASIQWIEGIVGQILAALLTLLVSGSGRKSDPPTTIAELKGDINSQKVTIGKE